MGGDTFELRNEIMQLSLLITGSQLTYNSNIEEVPEKLYVSLRDNI